MRDGTRVETFFTDSKAEALRVKFAAKKRGATFAKVFEAAITKYRVAMHYAA
jgi:hypothetical protein